MRSRILRASSLAVLACIGLHLGGCSDSPTEPGIQPQIISETDSFEYQVSEVQGYTGTLTYRWQNTGAVANVDQSTVVTGGSVTLLILDGAGAEVFSRSLADDGTFPTAEGQAGSWTVRVVYSDASGTVNFRVQKSG